MTVDFIDGAGQDKDFRMREERNIVWARRFEQGWWTE